MFNHPVSATRRKQTLIKLVRFYPVFALGLLAIAYLFGGFTHQINPIFPQAEVLTALSIFMVAMPVLFILGFTLVSILSDRELKRSAAKHNKFAYEDAFELPNEKMRGYKLALITGRDPTLTGLTGDRYKADDSATCASNPEHVPPVIDCECGFYAFKNVKEAKFELSINPGVFLIDVDLFGVGFEYERGYRAESQVVNHLTTPKRCMRCKIFSPKVFVASYKIGYTDQTWWQWGLRCGLCSHTFKESDVLTIKEMADLLKVVIV